jgi:hypothetical protein
MRSALPAITGLKDFSVSDVFCHDGNQDPIHPSLAGSLSTAESRCRYKPQRRRCGNSLSTLFFCVTGAISVVPANCAVAF